MNRGIPWRYIGASAFLAWASAGIATAQGTNIETSRKSEWANQVGLTGNLRADVYQSSKSFDSSQGFGAATVEVEALPKFSDRIDGKLFLRAGASTPNRYGASRTEAVEAYATLHLGQTDLRLGKQIVPWGRTDGINPTDNLTPRDYAILLPLEEDQRFGVWGAKLDYAFTPSYTLTLFAAPRFSPARLPWPVNARPLEHRPSHAGEAGMRLNVIREGLDWSVSYFKGRAPIPSVRPLGPSAASASGIVLEYDRIRVIGADIARNFGRFGVRGEIAYTQTDDKEGHNPFVRNPQLYWIAGVDRTFFDDLNINLQYFERSIRAYKTLAPPTSEAAVVAMQNAILSGQRDRVNRGITFRISDKWINDTLRGEILCVINTTRHDFFVRPLVTYAFSDEWKGMLGAEYYSGAVDTQFGSQKANRGLFAELRRSF